MYYEKKVVSIVLLSGLLCICLPINANASGGSYLSTDSLITDSITNIKKKFPYKQLILPVALVTYGTVETLLAGKVRLLNYAIGHEFATHAPTKFRIDDITQYIPAASVYVLGFSGVKGKHNIKDKTIILGIASLLMATSVNTIKYTAQVERPDKSARNSFPSGHTAVAFMGAEFLWQEYKDVSVWYGVAGYCIAAGTGMFRMYNNKHWLGDVVAGAGLGILSTKVAYLIYPTLQRRFSKNSNNRKALSFIPFYNGQQGGLSISINI